MKGPSARFLGAWREFAETPLDARLARAGTGQAEEAALALFRSVSREVPAYRAFLESHQIDPGRVRTPDDFRSLPLTTKENYISRFPLPQLCRAGRLESCDMVAVSSGSTGRPTFWLRSAADELEIAWRFEQVFHDNFRADQSRTLAVVCFALGTWVGGMYTAGCCRQLAAKGYPITVVTPGNSKDEIFRVVRELGPLFEQTVLLGYPPFLKDVIDTGLALEMDWKGLNIRLVTAGEVFSEEWRDLVWERLGGPGGVSGPREICYDTASLYGTADAGVIGNETPLSVCIRRFFARNPDAARELFGESRLPTLVQYDPLSRYFEEKEGTLLFSADNGIPLVRYNIQDTGGITPYSEMLQRVRDWGFDPVAELGPEARGVRSLPFAHVFGRSHFTISYFGANIYPENVSVGLEQPEIRAWVTGKFVLESNEDADRTRFLSIVVELAPGESDRPGRREAVADSVLRHLCRLNSEFAHYVPPDHQSPRITMVPAGDPEHFPVGVKHRYTRPPRAS